MLWLAAYNPEIDWEKREVKIIRCLPICGKRKQKTEIKGNKKDRKGRRQRSTKKDDTREVLEVEKGLWRKEVRKDASAKSLGLYYKVERRVHAEKRESVLIVKRREKGGTGICGRLAKKRVHLTL